MLTRFSHSLVRYLEVGQSSSLTIIVCVLIVPPEGIEPSKSMGLNHSCIPAFSMEAGQPVGSRYRNSIVTRWCDATFTTGGILIDGIERIELPFSESKPDVIAVIPYPNASPFVWLHTKSNELRCGLTPEGILALYSVRVSIPLLHLERVVT